MLAVVPALLLLLFAAWSGTFASGAGALAATSGHVAILLAALGAGALWRDPLRLGAGRLLPAALWMAAAASAWASPVGRAGRVGVALLPAFLLLPAAVERWWPDEKARRRGLRAVSAAGGVVAAWSLLHLLIQRPPRAAMPLGHHNLLAGWLVAVLPLMLLPWRERGPWRWLGAAAGLLGVLAVAATGSLLGYAALALEALLALLWVRRWHRWLLPAALLILLMGALQMPRLAAIVSGHDASARARGVYLDAGWAGFRLRPWLGWGPGAVPWTIGEFVRPIPGVNPPSEVIGDLHSLPLQVLYELGATGFLFTLATAAVFLRRRLAEREASADPALLAAGLIGLIGAAATRLGAASLAVTALPVALAVAAGAALAAKPRTSATSGGRVVPLLYAAAVVLALAPLDRAHARYDLAVRARDPQVAREHLAAARRIDPGFPLYSARHSWLEAESRAPVAAARGALAAAEQTPGLAPLWLEAGFLGLRAGEPWSARVLERASALDPLGALAPFHRLAAAPEYPGAPYWGARALLGEPRLLAALFWESRPALLDAAVREVETWPGVDAGWRAALVAAARQADDDRGPVALLGLEMDARPHLALSLHAFRRRPWPAMLAPVEVRGSAAAAVKLPPATGLTTTDRRGLVRAMGG